MKKSASNEFISDYETQKALGITVPVDNPGLPTALEQAKKNAAQDANTRPPFQPIFRIGDHGAASDAGDDIALCDLILDFDLIPYREKPAQSGYEIAYEVFEDHEQALFLIGSLKFKKADVEVLKALPGWEATEPAAHGHQLKWLEIRKANIMRLLQSRDQRPLGPHRLLSDALDRLLSEALAETEKQIAAYSGVERTASLGKKRGERQHLTATQAKLKELLPRWEEEAKILLCKNPSITIAGVYRSLKRKHLTLDPSGEDYSEKTFRKHIKHLFPAEKRRGGRPRNS